MRLLNKKAQSTLEYAILVAVVVGALLAVQVYMKRGVQGRLRSSTDNIGDQYSAGNVTSKFVTTETPSTTVENTGYDKGTYGKGKGVTYTEVTKAPTTTKQATGDNVEKITANLTDENLFNEQGELFD